MRLRRVIFCFLQFNCIVKGCLRGVHDADMHNRTLLLWLSDVRLTRHAQSFTIGPPP